MRLASSIPLLVLALSACGGGKAASNVPTPASRTTDTFATSAGDLVVTPIKHGTVLFQFQGKVIYVDPYHEGDFGGLPKADYVLLTDVHADHLDPKALDLVVTPATVLVGPPAVGAKIKLGVTIANGESKDVGPIGVTAVPMYNLERGPEKGKLFHDKGRGNGYVLTFGDKRVYLSGDTECTPEMKSLDKIDVAFVCMNLPYTMPPAEAAECIRVFRPKVVIPYHFRGQNLDELEAALKGEPGIEIRRRAFY